MRLALALLLATLTTPALAQATPDWSQASGHQVELFLSVFDPSFAGGGDPASWAPAIGRLVSIEEAYAREDLLTAVDRILANPDADQFEAIQQAQAGLTQARSLALWWDDAEARIAFLRFYTEVYLKDPALASDPEAFATAFLNGASTNDETNPARYLHQHLPRYGYLATFNIDPPTFYYLLLQTFDATLIDAARLGFGAGDLDLALYRESVLERLVTQIGGARKFAEARSSDIESWGTLMPAEEEPVAPVSETPPATEPASDTESGEVIEWTIPDEEQPPAEPFYEPISEAMVVEASAPIAAGSGEVIDWATIDIFALPGAAPTSGPPTMVITEAPPPAIEMATEAESAGDPELTFETETESESDLLEPDAADPLAITPLTEEELDALFNPPSESEPAPEPAIDPTAEPIAEPQVEPVVTPEPEPALDPAALEAAKQANREAADGALTSTLEAAELLGTQATDIVLLWNGASGEAAPDQATIDAAENAYQKQKEIFLAHLYLIDLYGVAARLGMSPKDLDDLIVAALMTDYDTRLQAAEPAVSANSAEIEGALTQTTGGVRERAGVDSIQDAQHRAYERHSALLAPLAERLEATLLPGSEEPVPADISAAPAAE